INIIKSQLIFKLTPYNNRLLQVKFFLFQDNAKFFLTQIFPKVFLFTLSRRGNENTFFLQGCEVHNGAVSASCNNKFRLCEFTGQLVSGKVIVNSNRCMAGRKIFFSWQTTN